MSLQANPLTDDHCKCLDKVLESVPPALELARACQDCGWDTSEYIAQLEGQKKMAELAKAKFFPHRP